MRQSLLDFGRKYVYRIFIYSSTFLALYLIIAVILILAYFGIRFINFSPILYIMATFDVVYVIALLLIMLFYGAKINK